MRIATLNIQGGFKIEGICREIKEKIAPVDLLCLQEVCQSKKIQNHAQQIAQALGPHYTFESFLPIDFKIKKMGNAFVYNKKDLKLLDNQGLTLPCPVFNGFWRSASNYLGLKCDRICHSVLFQTKNGLKIRMTNLHLDSVGGSKTRKKQIDFVFKILKEAKKSDLNFILGDFNTVGLVRKKFPELNLFKKNNYREISQEIAWTASPSHPDPNWKAPYRFFKIIKPFHPFLRQKMDYIFIKEKPKEPKCWPVDISSSDHRGLVLKLSL